MSPVFHGTLVSLSVTPAPDAVTVVTIPCRVEYLLDGPWVVEGRLVVNRELGITVRPTGDSHHAHDPYHLAEALNRIYMKSETEPPTTPPRP